MISILPGDVSGNQRFICFWLLTSCFCLVQTAYEAEFKTDGKMTVVVANDKGIPISGQRKIFLQVKGCGNAYFILTETSKFSDKQGNYYVVFLGTGNNGKINGIKDSCFSCRESQSSRYANILDCDNYVKLWVTWDDEGSVQIGRGADVDMTPFLDYTGNRSFIINYLNLMSPKYKVSWKVSSACHPGSFGRGCYLDCGHCQGGRTCDDFEGEDGLCPNGCEKGWQGPLCKERCDNGTYGDECMYVCGQCEGGYGCDPVDGVCPTGCQPGWFGVKCDRECINGAFGRNCERRCGHCRRGHSCDKISGSCHSGCHPGFTGATCSTECRDGTYGINCSSACGHCADGVPCDHVTGSCQGHCADGSFGSRCDVTSKDVMEGLMLINSSTLQACLSQMRSKNNSLDSMENEQPSKENEFSFKKNGKDGVKVDVTVVAAVVTLTFIWCCPM